MMRRRKARPETPPGPPLILSSSRANVEGLLPVDDKDGSAAG